MIQSDVGMVKTPRGTDRSKATPGAKLQTWAKMKWKQQQMHPCPWLGLQVQSIWEKRVLIWRRQRAKKPLSLQANPRGQNKQHMQLLAGRPATASQFWFLNSERIYCKMYFLYIRLFFSVCVFFNFISQGSLLSCDPNSLALNKGQFLS